MLVLFVGGGGDKKMNLDIIFLLIFFFWGGGWGWRWGRKINMFVGKKIFADIFGGLSVH